MQQRLPGDFMAVIAPCRRGMAVYALSQILKRPILPVVLSGIRSTSSQRFDDQVMVKETTLAE